VDPGRAFELSMRFAASQLGFAWTGRPRSREDDGQPAELGR